MTAFDRFEQQLPELMDELASPQLPDYFDDMLARTARTRQRPAWASLERWLPMGVIARPSLVPPLPWRSVGILVILGLLVVAGALVYVSSRQRLPEPFGEARNGAILYSTADGDILSVDPVSGVSRAIVTGSTRDGGPLLSRDGTKFVFIRTGTGPTSALFVANVDGSGLRQLFEGEFGLLGTNTSAAQIDRTPFVWSPDGAHVALISTVDFTRKVTVLATDGSSARTLDLGMSVSSVNWRPNGTELLFRGEDAEDSGTTYGIYRVNSDGTDLRPILPPNSLEYAWQAPAVSPDGAQVAFASWGDPGRDGIHVVGIDTGVDRVLDFVGQSETDEYQQQFSPDGTQLLFARFRDGEYQLNIVPVGGGGQPVEIGPRYSQETADPFMSFSPDGTLILVTYPADGSTWLLESDGSNDQQVQWPKGQFQTWQRLAP